MFRLHFSGSSCVLPFTKGLWDRAGYGVTVSTLVEFTVWSGNRRAHTRAVSTFCDKGLVGGGMFRGLS